jgi:alpha-glutamyl/putrescinyl thymine pyrophosphorylase clade 1
MASPQRTAAPGVITASQLTPRPGVYDLYWKFAAERHHILQRRLAASPPPWTSDPILREFKFCNAYRAADRVSQYMIRICYHAEPCTPEDRLFQITAFRTFSRPATWEAARGYLGRYPVLEDLASGRFTAALEHARAVNGGLYTGAFILCANNAYGQPAKHLNHVELWRHMFLTDGLAARLLEAPTLGETYRLLRRYPLMGDFMSYQTAIDIGYSDLARFGEDGFVVAGPGALRGIRKVFQDTGSYTPADVVAWMADHQQQEFGRLGLDFAGLRGRPLQLVDCQSLFCETDKYCRAAVPALASARTRIKARFTPSGEPLTLFFPPKWGINDAAAPGRIPAARSLGGRSGQAALF